MLLFNISMLTFHYTNLFTFEFPCTVNTSTEFTRHKMFNYIYIAINLQYSLIYYGILTLQNQNNISRHMTSPK